MYVGIENGKIEWPTRNSQMDWITSKFWFPWNQQNCEQKKIQQGPDYLSAAMAYRLRYKHLSDNCEVQCNVKRWKLKDLSKGWRSKDKVEICWVWSRVDTNRWSFSRIKYSRRRSEVWWCDSSDSILTLNKQRARCETRVNKLLPLICQQGYVQLGYIFRTHLWVIWNSLKIWYSISCTNTTFYHLELHPLPHFRSSTGNNSQLG